MLEEHGGRGVRMGDIARESGISRQAVYLHFASRTELLVAATRYLDEKLDVDSRLAPSRAATSGIERLSLYIECWGNYIPEIYGVGKALLLARDTDDAAAAAWDDRMAAMRDGCRAAIDALHADEDPRTGMDTAEGDGCFVGYVTGAELGSPHHRLRMVDKTIRPLDDDACGAKLCKAGRFIARARRDRTTASPFWGLRSELDNALAETAGVAMRHAGNQSNPAKDGELPAGENLISDDAIWAWLGVLLGCRLITRRGAVAQLGERRVRNAEVGSSILLGSTN